MLRFPGYEGSRSPGPCTLAVRASGRQGGVLRPEATSRCSCAPFHPLCGLRAASQAGVRWGWGPGQRPALLHVLFPPCGSLSPDTVPSPPHGGRGCLSASVGLACSPGATASLCPQSVLEALDLVRMRSEQVGGRRASRRKGLCLRSQATGVRPCLTLASLCPWHIPSPLQPQVPSRRPRPRGSGPPHLLAGPKSFG